MSLVIKGFVGGVVHLDDVTDVVIDGHVELIARRSEGLDELTGNGMDCNMVSRDDTSYIERALRSIDDILAFALFVRLGERTDTDCKTMVVLPRVQLDLIVLLHEVDEAVIGVVDEPNDTPRPPLRGGEGIRGQPIEIRHKSFFLGETEEVSVGRLGCRDISA